MAATATSVRLRPLGDRVLVKALEKKDELRSGLIIPDTAKEKPAEGEVVAVGPGARDEAGRGRRRAGGDAQACGDTQAFGTGGVAGTDCTATGFAATGFAATTLLALATVACGSKGDTAARDSDGVLPSSDSKMPRYWK